MKYLRDDEFLLRVGAVIREIRSSKNISQQELAYLIEIERSQIARIERGELNTGICTIYAISKALNVPICDIFNEKI